MQEPASDKDEFGQRLRNYEVWRRKLTTAIESYGAWYHAQKRQDAKEDLRLLELIEELRSDTLTIALVGEFSRGKTELINAIFFADYDRRLLPSTPGRTTMCPTEIRYDEKVEPCIRLLPIETRKSPLAIAELKNRLINWTTLPLDLKSPDAMANTLKEILKRKKINKQTAHELGLNNAAGEFNGNDEDVEIPVWRHAIVNYPHRLLRQGLVILDTPGLNALGAEPELTLNMLSKAHAILFVLGADTGVTKTDMEVWNNHVCTATRQNQGGRIVALNKIDTLWDELQGADVIEGFINRQAEETRRLLEIDRHRVFPVSARNGLIGKIRKSKKLISSSGLPNLENKLSEYVVYYKQKTICEKVANEIGSVVKSSRELINIKIDSLQTELKEINDLQHRSADVIDEVMQKLKKQSEDYNKEVQSFQVTRRLLSDQAIKLLGLLDIAHFDELIARTRLAMRNSWTTPGLRRGMQTFFRGTTSDLKKVETQTEEIRTLVKNIYTRFHRIHGMPKMQPARFSAKHFMIQYNALYEEAENFRKSPAMIMTEQHYVMKKFFITLVSRGRVIFLDCNKSVHNWAKAVLIPIYTQIEEHKTAIDRRLVNLDRLRSNYASLNDRKSDIEKVLYDVQKQGALMDSILTSIYETEPD